MLKGTWQTNVLQDCVNLAKDYGLADAPSIDSFCFPFRQ